MLHFYWNLSTWENMRILTFVGEMRMYCLIIRTTKHRRLLYCGLHLSWWRRWSFCFWRGCSCYVVIIILGKLLWNCIFINNHNQIIFRPTLWWSWWRPRQGTAGASPPPRPSTSTRMSSASSSRHWASSTALRTWEQWRRFSMIYQFNETWLLWKIPGEI